MNEPVWLQRSVVLALHDQLLAEFGGTSGIRDEGGLQAALERPRQAFAYGVQDIISLATLYAVGMVQGHPFIDGNKRTGFVFAVVFLEINGHSFNGSEQTAVIKTLGLAANEIKQEDYEQWLRDSCSKV